MTTNQRDVLLVAAIICAPFVLARLLYSALGSVDADTSRGILALVLVVILPFSIIAAFLVTRRLMRAEITAYHHGADQALDKVTKHASEVATVRTAMHTTLKQSNIMPPPPDRGWNDLLPPRANIVIRQDDDQSPLEL